jgi:glutamate dehydrogenase
VDADGAPLTVVGIGDMSGDVFGNGLLLSRHVRLVGAFDHRHVFLDPDPDPAAAWAERRRLFRRPGSSWADYDPALISSGGGVFPRTAKAVPLDERARAVLGVEDEALAPADLIRALLRAPVDLLWNGGVGTYVKARAETHAEVGDKANDGVRVDAADLRARVVAEGGNLGLTQRARVEFARAGGRVNTDAIDNSAGVDCSDHEVNIKILLDRVVAAGDLTVKQRNGLLADMTDEVAAHVLGDNTEQVWAIDVALAQAPGRVGVHVRYLRRLEQSGRLTAGERGTPPPSGIHDNRLGGADERERLLDRAVEFLPDDAELDARRAAGAGLAAPELAVLLAYTKNLLAHRLVDSDVPEDPFLGRELLAYFPAPVRQRYADRVADHPLRREIVATAVANLTVNRAGITFIFRTSEETSATVPDLVRAHAAATELFALDDLADSIGSLDAQVPAAVQTAMLIDVRRLAERVTRWLIHHRRPPLDITATVASLVAGVATLGERFPALVGSGARRRIDERTEALVGAGVPPALAARVAALDDRFATLDIAAVAVRTGHAIEEVAEVYFRLGDELLLDWLRDRVAELPRSHRWEALARAALRDDLQRLRAGLADDVVRTPDAGGAAGRLARWATANDAAVQRYRRILGDVTDSAEADLAPLSVVVREIRNLIESSPEPAGAGPGGPFVPDL